MRTLIFRVTDPETKKHISPKCLFLPAISATHSPAMECDYNLHKSNATYLTDLDTCRGNLMLLFFGKHWHPIPGPKHLNMILGGCLCVWKKEIKPYQRFEVWTRIISWDEKWLYVVSHFVKAGVFDPEEYVMRPYQAKSKGKGKGKKSTGKDADRLKAIYASSVSKYVIKNNRRTIPPEQILQKVGLYPTEEAEIREVEAQRAKLLLVGRLEAGWDAVHDTFEPGRVALGRYGFS